MKSAVEIVGIATFLVIRETHKRPNYIRAKLYTCRRRLQRAHKKRTRGARIISDAPPPKTQLDGLAVDDAQVVRGLGEGLVTVLGDDTVVFQAHAAHAGQVDAGLHGDNRADLDDILAAVKVG